MKYTTKRFLFPGEQIELPSAEWPVRVVPHVTAASLSITREAFALEADSNNVLWRRFTLDNLGWDKSNLLWKYVLNNINIVKNIRYVLEIYLALSVWVKSSNCILKYWYIRDEILHTPLFWTSLFGNTVCLKNPVQAGTDVFRHRHRCQKKRTRFTLITTVDIWKKRFC